jgi:predicted DNA-binding antitoxin AbrB/MazE fold protein
MGNDFESILEQYIQAEQALLDIRGIVAEYEKTQAACKEALKAIMDERKVNVWEGEKVKVTRSADSKRRTFDLKLLQEQCPKFPAKWMKEIETKGYKESVTKGRMTITIK